MTRPRPVVVGVDPGAKDTGIVVRHARTLHAHHIQTRTASEDIYPGRGVGVGPTYLGAVVDQVQHLAVLAVLAGRLELGAVLIAVEGVVRPSGHIDGKPHITDPAAALGTAMVLGAVLTAFPEAVTVPPGGNGSHLLVTYPHDLVTTGERRLGLNRPAGDSAQIRHCRSAWDIAGAAPGALRVRDTVQRRLPA